MNKPYSVKLGTPDELKNIESEGDREILVPARDVYEAHKLALNKCKGVEEVLSITLNNKKLYNNVTGFCNT